MNDARTVVVQRKGPQNEAPGPKGRGNARSGEGDFLGGTNNTFDANNSWNQGQANPWDPPRKGATGRHPHDHPHLGHGAPGPIHLEGDPPDVYVVESGDNYWRISKKTYGTARYFTALARFNESRIPDPKAIRPVLYVFMPTAENLSLCLPHPLPI